MSEYFGWTPPPGEVVKPPCHPETKVLFMWSDGVRDDQPRLAGSQNWSAEGDGPRVVAYAVVEEYKPAPDEGWCDWRTDISEWDTSTHDVRFECIGGIHKISLRPRSEVTPAAREVVAWAVVRGDGEYSAIFRIERVAQSYAKNTGGTVVKLTGVMPNE